jgi:serine protease AprX
MTLKLSQFATRSRIVVALVAMIAALATAVLLQGTSTGSAILPGSSQPVQRITLSDLAATDPARKVEVIVQLNRGVDPAYGTSLVQQAGGTISRELPIINGYGATLPAGEAEALKANPNVHAITMNSAIKTQGVVNPAALATSFNQSIRSFKVWEMGYTGKGVGVAVIDTGIAGDLPDFRVSQSDPTSRVIATAVTNPAATTVRDTFGHGTHIAGLIAGNGTNRPAGDPLYGKYAGAAPDANLIAVKASDDAGNATVLDVIDGLQFVVDKKNDYNIRVVNLSLRATEPQSYKTDPLDAAVEAAWNSGIVVVVAAGNEGEAPGAVNYAPANDPYVITVGGVDDNGTKTIDDDQLAVWSSRGTTQDGFEKPEVVAPGAHLISTIAPGSAYTQMCPQCMVSGQYFQVGGTSMAAAVVSGEAADVIQAYPNLTPDQVKKTIIKRSRPVNTSTTTTVVLVDASGAPLPTTTTSTTTITNGEVGADKAINNPTDGEANNRLTMNTLLNPLTGLIDWARASWTRASWTDAGVDPLRASWTRASWTRASWTRASWTATPDACADFERASWTRASWTRASWTRASWTRASWTADGMSSPDLTPTDYAALDAEIAKAKLDCAALLKTGDPSRASWTRASWTRASWTSSFTK